MNNAIIRRIVISKERIVENSYIWNMSANLLFAFQSVILLIILTRTVSLEDAGIFTIAYANASLFLIIGKYGFRNYQVSDVKNQNTFGDYGVARVLTVVLMCVSGIVYPLLMLFNSSYSPYKAVVIALMCIYKVPDAVEDLYYGEYQRQGRLDIAAKCMTLRLTVSVLTFVFCVCISRSLIIGLAVSTGISIIFLVYLIVITRSEFSMKTTFTWSKVGSLLVSCTPLFLGYFLQQYISNAPKYVIDRHLSDEIQACYGFISMPVFIISLLSSIVYNPIIHKMAESWQENDKKKFVKEMLFQIIVIMGLTICSLIGAWLIGIPVLSVLYNTDLVDYKKELLFLLIGGGFLAISSFLNVILTIMRKQIQLLAGYLIVAIIAVLFSEKVIVAGGVWGASVLYASLMAISSLVFCVFVVIGFDK